MTWVSTRQTPEEVFQIKEVRRSINRSVTKLSRRERAVLQAKLEGRTFKEISDALGAKTGHSIYKRALSKLSRMPDMREAARHFFDLDRQTVKASPISAYFSRPSPCVDIVVRCKNCTLRPIEFQPSICFVCGRGCEVCPKCGVANVVRSGGTSICHYCHETFLGS